MKKVKNILYLTLIFFIFDNYVIADESLVILTTFAQTGSSSKTILIMKDRLEKELKQNITIEYGGGSSSALRIIKEEGNENFLYISTIGVISLLPGISNSFEFSSSLNTQPISKTTSTPNVLIIRSDLGINNLQQLIEYSNSKNKKLRYSYIAPTSIHRLEFEGLIKDFNLNLELDESLRGSANVMKAISEKNLDLAITTSPYVAPLVDQGDALPLLVAHPERIELFPNTPTMLEYGLSSFPHGSWAGIFAPTGISDKRINEFFSALTSTLKDSYVATEIEKLGMDISPSSSPNNFSRYIEDESNRLKLAAEKYNFFIN